jgi:hypothetical protein
MPWAEEGSAGGAGASTMGQLNGTWRLVYSSGFASGSLGGLRPGPPAALVPVTIGQVRGGSFCTLGALAPLLLELACFTRLHAQMCIMPSPGMPLERLYTLQVEMCIMPSAWLGRSRASLVPECLPGPTGEKTWGIA